MGGFRCELRLLIALNGSLTSPHSPSLPSRCKERTTAGEASANSPLIFVTNARPSRHVKGNISCVLSGNIVTFESLFQFSPAVLTERGGKSRLESELPELSPAAFLPGGSYG